MKIACAIFILIISNTKMNKLKVNIIWLHYCCSEEESLVIPSHAMVVKERNDTHNLTTQRHLTGCCLLVLAGGWAWRAARLLPQDYGAASAIAPHCCLDGVLQEAESDFAIALLLDLNVTGGSWSGCSCMENKTNWATSLHKVTVCYVSCNTS